MRRRHIVVEERTARLRQWVEETDLNRIEPGDRSLGIITAGVAYQYAREIFPTASFLKLGVVWPLPEKLIRDFAGSVERVIVIEELDPFMEEWVQLLGINTGSRLFSPLWMNSTRNGSNHGHQGWAVGQPEPALPANGQANKPAPSALPPRPPVMCAGCGHRDAFWVMRKLKLTVNSDIGCYSLGALPPLDVTDTIRAMGASIGVAMGIRLAGLKQKNVAVIGDSTFFHSGLPALAAAVYNTPSPSLSSTTVPPSRPPGHPGSGKTLKGASAPVSIAAVARAMGVRHVFEVTARSLEETETAIREAMQVDEPSLVEVRAICVFEDHHPSDKPYEVVLEDCNGCTLCFTGLAVQPFINQTFLTKRPTGPKPGLAQGSVWPAAYVLMSVPIRPLYRSDFCQSSSVKMERCR
ncbi:MAG: thiamine pyrophosphate-dependent enzyme [Anaerolineae bacterium]